MKTFAALRETYPVFRFHAYDLTLAEKTVEITYHFEIAGLAAFAPHWSFPRGTAAVTADDPTLRRLAFSLGMVELVSYWKLCCCPRVEILAGALDDAQCAWWKRLYFHGLGEFFYRNGITPDADSFMELVSCGEPIAGTSVPTPKNGCLVPIGGGKDSAVTLELLRGQKATNFCFIINPRGATLETVKAAGYDAAHTLAVHRTLDKTMLELNRAGYLNGHTPFSAIVAFSSVLTAYLHGLRYVVLSNESSANESTVAGSTVNHQYSKSFAFERDFHEYEEKYIRSGVLYFSLLRPMSEYKIAGLFAEMPHYHRIFRSCNVGSKEDIWCGHCPKCLFVFLILSPFLPHAAVCDIFGRDMLADEEMQPIFDQLIGIVSEKPFECVGSRGEVNTAAVQTVRHMEAAGEKLPYLLQYYKTTPLFAQYSKAPHAYENDFDEENLLPPAFTALVRATY